MPEKIFAAIRRLRLHRLRGKPADDGGRWAAGRTAGRAARRRLSDLSGSRSSNKGWTCSASLFFEGGALTRVTFAHKDVVSPYEEVRDPKTGEKHYVTPPEACTFSLPNCTGR